MESVKVVPNVIRALGAIPKRMEEYLRNVNAGKLYFKGFKRSWIVISDWWISIRFVSFCVSRFVACDRNYD